MSKLPILSLESVNAGMPHAILCGKSPVYAYEGSKRISEKPSGWRIAIAMQGNFYEKISVRIDNPNDPLPEINETILLRSCASLKPLFVKFKNCRVSVYSNNGSVAMSAVADAVELVSFSTKQ